MKKIVYLLLGLTLFTNTQMLVLAIDEDDTLIEMEENEVDENEVIEYEAPAIMAEPDGVDGDTLNTVESKDDFLEAVMVKKDELERLRTQINDARTSNNELMLQLKSQIRNQSKEQIKAKLAEIKSLRKKIKDEVDAAKSLTKEKNGLEESSDNNELDDVVSTVSRRDDINKQLNSKKDVVAGYRSELDQLKQEVKQYKEEKQNQYQQMKQLHAQIKTCEKNLGEQDALQNQVWSEFKSSIEDEDYSEAIDAFDNVIEVKTDMLSELETRGELLEELNELY